MYIVANDGSEPYKKESRCRKNTMTDTVAPVKGLFFKRLVQRSENVHAAIQDLKRFSSDLVPEEPLSLTSDSAPNAMPLNFGLTDRALRRLNAVFGSKIAAFEPKAATPDTAGTSGASASASALAPAAAASSCPAFTTGDFMESMKTVNKSSGIFKNSVVIAATLETEVLNWLKHRLGSDTVELCKDVEVCSYDTLSFLLPTEREFFPGEESTMVTNVIIKAKYRVLGIDDTPQMITAKLEGVVFPHGLTGRFPRAKLSTNDFLDDPIPISRVVATDCELFTTSSWTLIRQLIPQAAEVAVPPPSS